MSRKFRFLLSSALVAVAVTACSPKSAPSQPTSSPGKPKDCLPSGECQLPQ
jgi:hypothetical protein